MKDFSKLCLPAKIYFAIAVVATVLGLFSGLSLWGAFLKMLFALFWTYVLCWLCNKGYTSISWALVLLPYVFIMLAVLNIYHLTYDQRQFIRMLKLQGPYGQEPMSSMASMKKK